ncbi:MAG: glucosamine-6-phosphate deaminase [Treponema sp.]|nr:glucosamine-6-phosphate deaminase [Treponema sp.]
MRLLIHENSEEASLWTAWHIADAMRERAKDAGRPFVLGLPTGDSPRRVYAELARLHREENLSFANARSFNMDEYVGLGADHPQSYRRFMRENLFDLVDINPVHARVPDGMAADLDAECARYEKDIADAGGIDLFLGGMGSDGHIAFNEPGSSLLSRTRVEALNMETVEANARFFGGDAALVPKRALTVGVATVMDAREVVAVVFGRSKARALKAVVEGAVSHMWTLSCLQMHPRATIVCDEAATDELMVKTARHFKEVEREELAAFRRRLSGKRP